MAVRHEPPEGLHTHPTVAAAVAAALAHHPQAPILGAVDLLIHACVRAAKLYPEWAAVLDTASSREVDTLAQHLVASNLHVFGDTGP